MDRLTVSRIPILLGEGIPLFGPLPDDVHLKHQSTTAHPSGVVQSSYVLSAR